MIMTVLRQQPRAAGLVLGLIAANLLAWCWALQAFGDSGALMAASLLAWGYGLRHAVDADHIAAIDNVTRKMMQQGRRPFAVGAWFSLGHSTAKSCAMFACLNHGNSAKGTSSSSRCNSSQKPGRETCVTSTAEVVVPCILNLLDVCLYDKLCFP